MRATASTMPAWPYCEHQCLAYALCEGNMRSPAGGKIAHPALQREGESSLAARKLSHWLDLPKATTRLVRACKPMLIAISSTFGVIRAHCCAQSALGGGTCTQGSSRRPLTLLQILIESPGKLEAMLYLSLYVDYLDFKTPRRSGGGSTTHMCKSICVPKAQ
eukprot:2657107-Amphidinium_carterae.2